MLDVTLNEVRITGNKLTRAWNTIFDKPHNVNYKIKGINYRICTTKYTDKYDKPTICVNDSWIFKKYFYGWIYSEDTAEYKESCIGDYEEDRYSLICDAGSFIVNDLMFSNGVGDGSYPCIVRTFNSIRHYYTRADIYDNVTKVYPINGICKVNKYDCNTEDVYTFDNVKEIQIAQGKLYIIRVALGDNRGLFHSCYSI
jgi:hypothetical protein